MPCFALHRLGTASEVFRCRLLDQSNLSNIHTILILCQLRWAGHVARMPDHRVPKKLFYAELQQEKHSHGGQKERFKGTLKTTLKAFNINSDTWEQTAMDRAKWRYSIYKDDSLAEERTTAAQQKRQARTAQASKQENASDSPCPSCHRTFRARFALISHLHIHKSSQSTPFPSLNPKISEVVLVDSTDKQQQFATSSIPHYQSWITMNNVWTQFSR